MSILAAVPGGSLLEEPIETPMQVDWSPFAKQYTAASPNRSREVWDEEGSFIRCSAQVVVLAKHIFASHALLLGRLSTWQPELVRHAELQVSQTDCVGVNSCMVPTEMFVKKNESELSVELANGSLIAMKGADNADSLRGVSLSSLIN